MQSLRSHVSRGALVVFEGCDKCGKSTQSSLLVEYLKSQNVPVKHMAFPDRKSSSGSLINAYLTNKHDMPDECIHLLFTLNRWELQNEMKRLLNNGTTLIVDRYSYSGVVYSAAKGLSDEWCMSPERGLIRPDLVFYLKADVNTLSSRGNFGTERYEVIEFQKKVGKIFDDFCRKEREYWKEVDAKQSVESIHEQVSSETMKLIRDVSESKLNILWPVTA